jgi:hypothetical protein
MEIACKVLELAYALYQQYKTLHHSDETARRLCGRVENVSSIMQYHNGKGTFNTSDGAIQGCLSRMYQTLLWLHQLTSLYQETHQKKGGFFKGAATQLKDFFKAHNKLAELEASERALDKELNDLQLALNFAAQVKLHNIEGKQNMALAHQQGIAVNVGGIYQNVEGMRQQQQAFHAQNARDQQALARNVGGIHQNMHVMQDAVQGVREQFSQNARSQVRVLTVPTLP